MQENNNRGQLSWRNSFFVTTLVSVLILLTVLVVFVVKLRIQMKQISLEIVELKKQADGLMQQVGDIGEGVMALSVTGKRQGEMLNTLPAIAESLLSKSETALNLQMNQINLEIVELKKHADGLMQQVGDIGEGVTALSVAGKRQEEMLYTLAAIQENLLSNGEAALNLKRSEIQIIKLSLAQHGCEPGDGHFLSNAKTRDAIRCWQKASNVVPTGYLDRRSAHELQTGLIQIQDCDDFCPEMVVVRPGEFLMGSPVSEHGQKGDEKPVHRVEISYDFAVGIYEVTIGEWEACVREGGCNSLQNPDNYRWQHKARPVTNVTWDEAMEYVAWLSERSKSEHKYQLLSEAEWEYVARADTTTPFHTGLSITAEQANYNWEFEYGKRGKSSEEFLGRTADVGSFAPNAHGLYDVHGNVREWTRDCWNHRYQGAPKDGRAWLSGNCNRRVTRGGSWQDVPTDIRSARRLPTSRDGGSPRIGFRVMRMLEN